MIHFEKKEKYLLITGAGERKGLLTVEDGAKKIFAAIQEAKMDRVLVDYRNVNFEMPNTDAFNSVRFYENKLPQLTRVTVAVIVNLETVSLGGVWSEVARARGFQFNVFTDWEKAEKWLLDGE